MTSVSYGREEPGRLICYIIGLRKDIRTKNGEQLCDNVYVIKGRVTWKMKHAI
jgi:hypothetical protein